MQHVIRPGDVLADRYLLVDLLYESGNGRFWRAHDRVLARHVAMHVLPSDDPRAPGMLDAARRSAAVADRRLLRVLDAADRDGLSFVVNEWGSGRSLDIVLATEGPLSPRRAAWLVGQAAAGVAAAHRSGVCHGHLSPENLLIDRTGSVRIIGFAVEAALRGLDGDETDDVRDLAGLLYAALTGRWPGDGVTQVPAAPREGELVLRPRQVRAGIPRVLDTLCDEVLSPAGTHLDRDRGAAELEEELAVVVGDDSGMAAAEAARHRAAAETTAVHGHAPAQGPPAPPHPSGTPTPAAPAAGVGLGAADDQAPPAPPAEEAPDGAATALTPRVPEQPGHLERSEEPEGVDPVTGGVGPAAPTQAGMPIFDEERDEVDWLRHHTDSPAPPPPFDEPPERPLFAPGPPDDARTQRGRQEEASRAHTGSFWPWDTGVGAPPPQVEEPAQDPAPVPGRRSLRAGIALIVLVLTGLAVLVAYNAGRDGDLLGDDTAGEPSAAPDGPASGSPLPIVSVTDLDPQGSPPEEKPELTDLAADGDPSTAWETNSYAQQFGPGGLKDGLGLVVDLGEFRDVSGARVQVEGETGLQLYVADTEPTDVADLSPVASAQGADVVELLADSPDTGRYVVVWIDSLPASGEDGFRARVAEITVLG